jgi:hypothetical protein
MDIPCRHVTVQEAQGFITFITQSKHQFASTNGTHQKASAVLLKQQPLAGVLNAASIVHNAQLCMNKGAAHGDSNMTIAKHNLGGCIHDCHAWPLTILGHQHRHPAAAM